jgi:hypothetical protein
MSIYPQNTPVLARTTVKIMIDVAADSRSVIGLLNHSVTGIPEGKGLQTVPTDPRLWQKRRRLIEFFSVNDQRALTSLS